LDDDSLQCRYCERLFRSVEHRIVHENENCLIKLTIDEQRSGGEDSDNEPFSYLSQQCQKIFTTIKHENEFCRFNPQIQKDSETEKDLDGEYSEEKLNDPQNSNPADENNSDQHLDNEVEDENDSNGEEADQTETKLAFQCPICDPIKNFGNMASLRRHTKDYHPEDPSELQCKYCPKEFTTISYRITHENDYCRSRPNVDEDSASELKEQSEIEEVNHIQNKTIFECTRCDPIKRFQARSSLTYHNSNCHPKDPSKLQCPYCKKVFFGMSYRKIHEKTCLMRRKVNEDSSQESREQSAVEDDNNSNAEEASQAEKLEKFQCTRRDPIKNYQIISQDLKRHVLDSHPEDPSQLQCKSCHKQFTSVYYRTVHEKSVCSKKRVQRDESSDAEETDQNSDKSMKVAEENMDWKNLIFLNSKSSLTKMVMECSNANIVRGYFVRLGIEASMNMKTVNRSERKITRSLMEKIQACKRK